MDPSFLLARLQFGLNVAFHILFPSLTIGLARMLAWFRIQYERTRDEGWLRTYQLWVKIFALSFAVGAVSDAAALKTLRFGAQLAAVLVPLQIVVGDQHGLNTLHHQPAKIAALEAIWHTERGAALTLAGIPDEQKGRTDFAVTLPKGASLILEHDPDAELKGLDAFPDHPPVAPLFFAFRAGWIATLAGWVLTDMGPQPWLVTGVLRTADAGGPAGGAKLGASLTAYLVTYAALLAAYMVTLKWTQHLEAIPP